ncbi:MAG: class I SAM-dependent methyltransferase [Candidatus Krumholzibacteria bacterium]|nr:class I SAM-dependent methyltransferase [Candidatus Krumholzibacteria bacterium]
MTGTPNPWLSIPAADYEAHMASRAVAQAQLLSGILRESVERWEPVSVAVLGCSAGNGFEHLRGHFLGRVVAVDINPEYIETTRERYTGSVPGLETICADIAAVELEPGSIDLVSCALVIEYVDAETVVSKAARWLRPGGVLSVVLQLPSEGLDEVTPTEYESLRLLEGFMRLVDPGALDLLAGRLGLETATDRAIRMETGKEFRLVEYRRPLSA